MALFNDTQVMQNNKDNSYGSCRLSYSQLMHGLKLAEIEVNRKMLADLAVNDAAAFTALADAAKAKLGK